MAPTTRPSVQRETPDIETSSADYASRFADNHGAYFLRVQREAVLGVAPGLEQGSQTVLEVGGGHGQLAGPLAAAGYHVTVLGSSAECSQRIGDGPHNNPIRFVAGDLLRLPFPDKSFDVVVSVRLLSHMDDWEALIAELCRVASHSVILDFPSLASVNILALATFALKRRIEGNTRTYRSFLEASLRRQFARHCFRKARASRQFVLPMAMHRLLRGAGWLQAVESFMRRKGLTALIGNPVILRMDRTSRTSPAPIAGD